MSLHALQEKLQLSGLFVALLPSSSFSSFSYGWFLNFLNELSELYNNHVFDP